MEALLLQNGGNYLQVHMALEPRRSKLTVFNVACAGKETHFFSCKIINSFYMICIAIFDILGINCYSRLKNVLQV
jgi:hypothetical protein